MWIKLAKIAVVPAVWVVAGLGLLPGKYSRDAKPFNEAEWIISGVLVLGIVIYLLLPERKGRG